MFQRSPLVLGKLHLEYTIITLLCLQSSIVKHWGEEYYLTESTMLLWTLFNYSLVTLLVATLFTREKWLQN